MKSRKMDITPLIEIKNLDLLYTKGLFIIDEKSPLQTLYLTNIDIELNTQSGLCLRKYKSLLDKDYIIEFFIDSDDVINVVDYVEYKSKEPYIIRYQKILSKFSNIDKGIKPVKNIHTYEKINLSNYIKPLAILSNGIYKFGKAKENKFYLT